MESYYDFVKIPLPLQNKFLASRILHRHCNGIATAVFDLNRRSRSKRPASRIFCSAHHDIEKVRAAAIFRLSHYDSASRFLHVLFSFLRRPELGRFFNELRLMLTQRTGSYLLNSEHFAGLRFRSSTDAPSPMYAIYSCVCGAWPASSINSLTPIRSIWPEFPSDIGQKRPDARMKR